MYRQKKKFKNGSWSNFSNMNSKKYGYSNRKRSYPNNYRSKVNNGFSGGIIGMLIELFKWVFDIKKSVQIEESNNIKATQVINTDLAKEYGYSELDYSGYAIKKPLTREESRFFFQLNNYLKGKDIILFSKMRLSDFVSNSANKYSSRLNQKHIDFIISDYKGNILCLIEVDGKSHDTYQMRKNDYFKNTLFEKINIPLIRYQNYSKFDMSRIDKYLV